MILIVFVTSLSNVRLMLSHSVMSLAIIRVPEDYSTIQAAVNAASSGDIILVAPDVYYENVVVNKSVRIVGENSINTVVEGAGGFLDTILVSADYVEITGLTVRNGRAGIWLNHSNHSNIHGNILTENTYWAGIVLLYSNENTITSNTAVNMEGEI